MDFDGAVLAPGVEAQIASRLHTAELLVTEASAEALLPLTEDKLRILGAALRGANYKSGVEILKVARAEHWARDLLWSGSLARTFSRCCRAVRRGQGPAVSQ